MALLPSSDKNMKPSLLGSLDGAANLLPDDGSTTSF
jgi:hypothetical protein